MSGEEEIRDIHIVSEDLITPPKPVADVTAESDPEEDLEEDPEEDPKPEEEEEPVKNSEESASEDDPFEADLFMAMLDKNIALREKVQASEARVQDFQSEKQAIEAY